MNPIKHDMMVMKDPFESHKIDKGDLPDLPFKMLVVGKSQFAGKTNLVANLLLRPMDNNDIYGMSYYKKDFEGEDMYVICPSTVIDHKWNKLIEYKKIPPGNIYTSYNESDLEAVYQGIIKKYNHSIENDERPKHSLIILDDCSFDGSLKSKTAGVIAKLFCNGRHYLISSLLTSQKYSQISTVCRENYTAMLIFESSEKQLETIYDDVGFGDKKDFKKLFREYTKEPHSFMVINAKFPPEQRFQDQYFRSN